MSRYRVIHVDGQPDTIIEAERWTILHFDWPIVPAPCAHMADGTRVIFDPRVTAVNDETGSIEWDGPGMFVADGDQIVRRTT